MENQAYKLQELVKFYEKMESLGFKVSLTYKGIYGFRKGKR